MENKLYRYIGLLLLLVVCLLIGYGGGYSKGSIDGMKLAVHVGFLILENQNIQIELSEEKILDLLFAYENQINSCEVKRNLTI